METEKVTVEQFWNAISILVRNYHAVNKKIFACLIEEVFEVEDNSSIADLVEPMELDVEKLGLQKRTESALEGAFKNRSKNYVIKQKLLTKKLQENKTAVIIIDFSASSYTCKFAGSSSDDFAVRYENEAMQFQALTQRNPLETSDRWLQHVLKPKLLKWAQSSAPTKPSTKSLQLIDVEAYNSLYKQLKNKHAQKLKEHWLEANESTDPLKFIYEDLAIAAYLICLWHSEHAKPPKAFADLGCGNGLLVYVLNEEGYKGFGYDIRKRKLWTLYPTAIQARLIEAAVVPLEFTPPTEVDWLIGNHSDELSAWLPVLATLERYEMSYFLLPCCAFEFSGAKFQRRNAEMSTYQDFYGYVREVSVHCGFQTLEDRLKIPSTKRLALIGARRTYESTEHEVKCQELRDFVDAAMKRFPHNSKEDAQIKLREKHEVVRNCSKLDKDVLAALVGKIFGLLLKAPRGNDAEDESWHAGGCLLMKEIAQALTQQDLQHIKSECGGIKTLLRNKHEVFEFRGNDLIGLRKPQKRKRPQRPKYRACYFHENHPDGCPLPEAVCNFVHDKPS